MVSIFPLTAQVALTLKAVALTLKAVTLTLKAVTLNLKAVTLNTVLCYNIHWKVAAKEFFTQNLHIYMYLYWRLAVDFSIPFFIPFHLGFPDVEKMEGTWWRGSHIRSVRGSVVRLRNDGCCNYHDKLLTFNTSRRKKYPRWGPTGVQHPTGKPYGFKNLVT